MTTIEAVAREPSGPDARLRLTLARILLTPLCVIAIAVVAFRDLLAAAIGGAWIPQVQLSLQFNSLAFLLGRTP
jgi:hypothetical protein